MHLLIHFFKTTSKQFLYFFSTFIKIIIFTLFLLLYFSPSYFYFCKNKVKKVKAPSKKKVKAPAPSPLGLSPPAPPTGAPGPSVLPASTPGPAQNDDVSLSLFFALLLTHVNIHSIRRRLAPISLFTGL